MIVTAEVGTRQLADLVKQVQAGDEVLLTQGNKPVAKIVSASEKGIPFGTTLRIRSFKGRRVLTPIFSQQESACWNQVRQAWINLLRWMRQFNLGRKRILDTQLAAILHSYNVRRRLTSNPTDCAIFGVLETVTP